MNKLFTCLLLCYLMFSCREENALLYSCDPVLNEIITEHLQEYVTYTVKEVSLNSFPVQQAIFRTYTPQKKREIWMEKINFLLLNENYSPDEYAHVSKLLNELTENYFDPDTLKATVSQRDQFNAAWSRYATDSLGWTKSYVIFAVHRLYIQFSDYEKELSALVYLQSGATSDGEGDEQVPCNCGDIGDCDNGWNCSDGCTASSGCGIFMVSPCTGLCRQ